MQKMTKKIVLGSALLFAAFSITVANATPNNQPNQNLQNNPGDSATMVKQILDNKNLVTEPNGLKYLDVKVGNGATAKAGDTVTVHYTGWLTDGTKFDSSRDRTQPFIFKLGAGQVIKGWDDGVAGMQVGGVRDLVIPADLGYGARGAGGVIPPNATLVFEVELLKIGS